MSEKKLIEMRGNHIVVRMLEELGVKTMFAYPGGFSLELHQALSKSPIRVILPRNEQGGAFGADGFARMSGEVGVCMATSGPGATNLVSGIADAAIEAFIQRFLIARQPNHHVVKLLFVVSLRVLLLS